MDLVYNGGLAIEVSTELSLRLAGRGFTVPIVGKVKLEHLSGRVREFKSWICYFFHRLSVRPSTNCFVLLSFPSPFC